MLHSFTKATRCPALLLMLVVLLAACGSEATPEGSTTTATAPQAVIGVSLLSMTHVFFQDLADELKTVAEQQNVEVILTAGEFDIARQQNQIQDFIVQQVDAIVLSPVDSKAIGTSIQAANEAGIPVFTVDIAALAEGIDIVTHIATDNLSGGRLAGEAVIEAIGQSGKIAIIDHPEVESVILRTRGFHEVIDAANADGAQLEIVAQLPALGVQDRAFRVAEDILQAHPEVDAIFAINDQTALGALAAIEKANKVGEIKVVGFDGTPEARQAILEGKIHADVIQHPREIGRMTVEAIMNYMSGEVIPPEVLIPATLYRQSDAAADPMLKTDA